MGKRYDLAIIGSGPAGLSAAINAKVRNKNLLLFGSSELSGKLRKAPQINNYLGMYGKTGEEVAEAFQKHLQAMDIPILEERVTNIYPTKDFYSILTKDHMYEADAIILTSGVDFAKPLKGEREFLGSGISYCVTCDALFFRNKTAAIIGFHKRDEEEVDFLASVAKKVYYIPMYKEEPFVSENVEIVRDIPMEIIGNGKVEKLILKHRELVLDGVFLLRESVAANQLIPGLAMEENHVMVDRTMKTNLAGCFAAGDITGKPYQYIKAAGEGNVAALSAVSYLDQKRRAMEAEKTVG